MTNQQAKELPPEDAKAGPQRVWLLVVWEALWVGVCSVLNTQDMETGVGNSALNAPIVLSGMGVLIWVVSSSGGAMGTVRYSHMLPSIPCTRPPESGLRAYVSHNGALGMSAFERAISSRPPLSSQVSLARPRA